MTAISLTGLIPVRSEASDKAEMCTQLLFGEQVHILENLGIWLKIKTLNDSYEGYCDAKMLTVLTDDEHEKLINTPVLHNFRVINFITKNENEVIPVPFGAILHPSVKNNTFKGTNFSSEFAKPDQLNDLIDIFKNAPYLWGGKSIFGIDCSGFTQLIYASLGIKIPRDASQQVKVGNEIPFISEVKTGDLAFFDNSEGQITHVGICLGNGKIAHASGKVRTDRIDHQGIYNEEIKKYSHKLRIIKRIL